MPPEDLVKKLRQSPFRPFRFFLVDGTSYDVRHPEMVLLGRKSLVLGVAGDPVQTLYDRTIDIDLLHISRMEQLETATRGNGEM